jgi:hypothetical protein
MHSDHVLLVSKRIYYWMDGMERCRSVPSFVHHIPSDSVLQEKETTCCDNLDATYRKRVHFICTSCVEYTKNHWPRPPTHTITPFTVHISQTVFMYDAIQKPRTNDCYFPPTSHTDYVYFARIKHFNQTWSWTRIATCTDWQLRGNVKLQRPMLLRRSRQPVWLCWYFSKYVARDW